MRFSIVWNWRSYVGLLISLMPKRGGMMGRLPKLHAFQLEMCIRDSDYTYKVKYGIRDNRGGGRSSARETISRVVAGALALSLIHIFA